MAISWRSVPVTSLGGEAIYGEAKRARLLRAYRDSGECAAWLCTPEELESLSDDEAVEAGPARGEIDWTGIDEAAE